VRAGCVKVFIAAIIKLMLTPPVAAVPGPKEQGYGRYNEGGEYVVSEGEAKRIHKDFQLFYLNRKAYNPRGEMHGAEDAKCIHKPTLCERSVTLASTLRDKYMSKEGTGGPADESRSEASKQLSTHEFVDLQLQMKKDLDTCAVCLTRLGSCRRRRRSTIR
jgi:hypothetical protein